ncbi:hypothetical protein BGZ63DRAFT_375868 [Mariannaea sp. PMI_226]|nr:hypothetical protein BGZ63DRAFT_375868 [Mariannaea sp. PMI_226]
MNLLLQRPAAPLRRKSGTRHDNHDARIHNRPCCAYPTIQEMCTVGELLSDIPILRRHRAGGGVRRLFSPWSLKKMGGEEADRRKKLCCMPLLSAPPTYCICPVRRCPGAIPSQMEMGRLLKDADDAEVTVEKLSTRGPVRRARSQAGGEKKVSLLCRAYAIQNRYSAVVQSYPDKRVDGSVSVCEGFDWGQCLVLDRAAWNDPRAQEQRVA